MGVSMIFFCKSLRGGRQKAHAVAVFNHLPGHRVFPYWHLDNVDLQAFAAGEFHGRYHVRVATKEDYPFTGAFEGECRHVDADAHINAFLLSWNFKESAGL